MVIVPLVELKKHNSPDDCWIAIHSKVYDVTKFIGDHPGGQNIILKYAGKDATTAYDEIHAPGIIEESIPAESLKGQIEVMPPASIELAAKVLPAEFPPNGPPPLESLLSVHDFQKVAREIFTKKTFAFYSSAATDLVTQKENHAVWRKLFLRPRVLRNVKDVCIKRRILDCECDAPFFVSPAAMARLAHSDGELAIARGCGVENIIQVISNNASYPLSDIVGAGRNNQPFFFQLYVNSERHKTEELLRRAKSLGVKAVLVTVDAPIPGKREADERITAENLRSEVSGAVAVNDKKGGGLGRIMARYIDSTLSWNDLEWLKEVSDLPIVLKGIQTAADAKKAVYHSVDGILLSNHGGRSMDTVQPAICTLLEIHKQCPEVLSQLEIFVDGGVSRGTDILKALCLGATAVGLGRPYLYSLAYGQRGVEHLTQILKDELISAMKLAGITHVDQAHPGMVNTSMVDSMIQDGDAHPWISWRPKAKL